MRSISISRCVWSSWKDYKIINCRLENYECGLIETFFKIIQKSYQIKMFTAKSSANKLALAWSSMAVMVVLMLIVGLLTSGFDVPMERLRLCRIGVL